MKRRRSTPPAASEAVTAYIEAAAEPARARLRALRAVIIEEAPDAVERIAYGLPTWHRGENLIHLGAFARHVGVYPGAAAMVAFAGELGSFHTSKGAIQLPHDRDLPVELVRRIVRWRVEKTSDAATPSAARKAPEPITEPAAKKKKAPAKAAPVKLLSGGNPQIEKGDGDAPVQAYIAAMPGWKRAIGEKLDAIVARCVPEVRKAVKWNSPFYGVEGRGWFLSFHVFARYVKVTFFKGTSLRPAPPGTSKNAEVRYVDLHEGDLDETQMARWVKQAAKLPGWSP